MRYKGFVFIFLLFTHLMSFGQSSNELFEEASTLRDENKKIKAIKKFEEALAKAESENKILTQMHCHIELAELKDNIINYKEALEHYKSFTALYKKRMLQQNNVLKDSVSDLNTEVADGIRAIDSLRIEQLDADLEIKELELSNERQKVELKESENRRNILILVLGMFCIVISFIILMYFRKRKSNSILKLKNEVIGREKERSESLLLNILPKPVAEELKTEGKTRPSKYDMATVMFTDFKNFTQFSEQNTPEDLVALIDYYFSAFDQIIEKHGVEKIKTIGDAYLCVSGIPERNTNHVENMILAAFEIQDFVTEHNTKQGKSGASSLQIRVGIHCGPLVAGVVGSKKFAYDVWGDTVNIAARMEQAGEPDGINVSESVYELVKDKFDFEYRGEVEAKNKGKMKMYFVRRLSA